ncbi:MAG: O-linked N-acetylglucosamine transferase family protein [Methylophilus sp.]|uniref:O-linked N-acetylglucosamine transferase family protein n=1 Tax=Methylophilus sp. TaxID=29541 RepID=UPI003FA0ED1D
MRLSPDVLPSAHSLERDCSYWMQQLVEAWKQGDWPKCLTLAQTITTDFPEEGLAWKLLGSLYQQQDQLNAAVEAFSQAGKLLKKDAEVFYNLANVHAQLQEHPQAIKHYRQTLKLSPAFSRAYANWASVLKKIGQLKEAEKLLRRGLNLHQQDGRVNFELATLLHEADKPLEAIQYYREAAAIEPGNPIIFFNMAAALELLGNESEAIQAYETAIAHQPDYVEAYSHLGALYLKKANVEEAEQWLLAGYAVNAKELSILKNLTKLYRVTQRTREYQQYVDQVMQLQDFNAVQLNNVAAELLNQNLFGEAERYCKKALEQDPGNPYIYGNLGLIEHARSAFDKACLSFERALELLPDSEAILSNYSISLRLLGRYPEAIASLEKAIVLKPDYLSAYINLSSIYLDLGKAELAIETLEKVLAQDPEHSMALRNLLFSDSYVNYLTEAKHADYVARLGQLMMQDKTPFQAWNIHNNDQRLRIGIVSADLRRHPVGYFIENWLKHFHPGQLEVYGYSTDGREDVLTHELKGYCNEWRSLAGLTDEQAARLIHSDGIHVLLDLSGLTGGTRLPVFAWKPAPVQAAWLGYWGTTGLPVMDYVIADPITANAQVAQRFTEQMAYLPHTRLCFTPPPFEIGVNALPAAQSGVVTFGCYQNYTKVTDAVLTLWGRIFAAQPGARLRWQCKTFNDAAAKAETVERLAKVGISAERCELLGMVTREAYLKSHHEVDMILDTFPFSGGTTTCEALWMGVPTVTLPGDTLIGRQGASMLTCAGLGNWVAASTDDYVDKAVAFASDLPALAATRSGLRAQVLQSPLMDAAQFAQDFETLLFSLWQQVKSGLGEHQLLAKAPVQSVFSGEQPVWVVSATRMTEEAFWRDAALGKSLKRHMRQDARLVASIACENTRGLSEIFNDAIAAAPEDALLVFIHDDVWIDENTFVQTISEGLRHYDVIGVAGNARIQPGQTGWCFVDTQFTWDDTAYLRGAVGHGQHAFGPASAYGEPAGATQLMDGVFLAAYKQRLVESQVRFDTQFDFHFYDLDFCRTATSAGLQLGVWPLRMTHQSGGAFGTQRWRDKYQQYAQKWEPAQQMPSTALEASIAEVFDLAAEQQQQGQHEAARALYQEILQIYPQHALSIHNLGLIAWHAQQDAQAIALFEQAHALAPEQWSLLCNYLNALHSSGNPQFEPVLTQALERGHHTPALQALLNSWGLAEQASGVATLEAEEAALLALFAQAKYTEMQQRLDSLLQLHPDWLNGWKMLSDVRMLLKEDAREPARRALALNAADPVEHCYYGLVLKAQGDLNAAVLAFEQAIALKPDYAAAYNNLGIVLKDLGAVDQAIGHFKQALTIQPNDAGCFSNLLFCMSHAQGMPPAELLQAHQAYAELYEAPLKAQWLPHGNNRDLDRPLRVGFVSADLRAHSIPHFLKPLLLGLASDQQLELYAYYNHPLSDEVTAKMREYFANWKDVTELSDASLAETIRHDAIDILIDLSGHTSGNRLLTFARKPAPVQISWLGYMNTTGLSAMDYYLTDQALTPMGEFDAQFTEKLVQLPVNAPFMPDASMSDVEALPALHNGYITFGCFNRPNKITQATVQLWAQLMLAVPGSRMIIGGIAASENGSHLVSWFEQAGIPSDRLELVARSHMADYLLQYHRVDICLDTFPSNGLTTTAHALWMGVPTLCQTGDRLTSRGAMALMQHAGLTQWIAADAQAWVAQGAALCADLAALAEVRNGMRDRLQQSLLSQPAKLSATLADALRLMWQRWCAGNPPQSFAMSISETHELPTGVTMRDSSIVDDQPEDISGWARLASQHQEAGDIEQAVVLYQKILEIDNHHAEANHHLGFIKVHTAGVEHALPYLETAVTSAPQNEQYWVTYIDAFIMLEDFTTAEAAITHALKYALSADNAALLRGDIAAQKQAKKDDASKIKGKGLPRITTLVPAYRCEYLAELLMSLTTQTYKHFRVIISDDSPEQKVTHLLSTAEFLPLVQALDIQVVQGPRKGTMTNIVHLFAQCDDEHDLIHVLFDDDLVYPRFYEKHVQAHLEENVGVSVSYRWFCNEKGQPYAVTPVPDFVNASQSANVSLDADQLFGSTIPHCNNWLGEFSNAVFTLDAVKLYGRYRMADVPYYGLGDIGVFLEIALNQKVILVKEYLGAFRQHGNQHSVQGDSRVFKCGVVAWVALALGACKLGKLSVEGLQSVVDRIQKVLVSRYAHVSDMQDLIAVFASQRVTSASFEQDFLAAWETLMAFDDWTSAQLLQGYSTDAMSPISA